MTTEHRHEKKPWQPKIEDEPEFNPFVNALERTGELENPSPLEETQAEEGESAEVDRVVREATSTTAPVARIAPGSPGSATAALIEPERRYALIAQAAYFLSERRGFRPGGELDDWLAAETEIDRTLASRF
jgi:hypothetical protein